MRRRSGFAVLFFAVVLGLLLLSSIPKVESSTPNTVAPGESTTLLPDGRWLILGGEGAEGPLGTGAIWDPRTGETTPLANPLRDPRAWHSATVLPNGTVLIVGGVGADGFPMSSVEQFDPATQTFEPLSFTAPTPRARHTATLLTDGRVLIAGGISDQGTALAGAELWDFKAQTFETLPEPLLIPRHSHSATLLPNGGVLVWGGVDPEAKDLENGELYDPATQLFTLVESTSLPALLPAVGAGPFLHTSLPENGATDVPTDTVIALRFSKPLQVETINADTVTLRGPTGVEAATPTPAEGGILVFVTPDQLLRPDARYTLVVDGPTDTAGVPLAPTGISFTTALSSPGAPSQTAGPHDPEEWIPGVEHFRGDWRSHHPDSPWQALPPLQAEPGITALAGQVLTLQGQPLPDVTLEIEGQTTRSDKTGRFLLSPLPAGRHELLIDGRTAGTPGKTYGIFEVGVDLAGGLTNVFPATIWMPRIDTAHAVTIPSPTTDKVVVTTPRIPGLELHIPPHTVIQDHEGRVVTEVSITPIPVDRPPFPLPSGVEVPVYFTIQPGGAYVKNAYSGARLIYPNYTHELPGTRINFWHYDPEERGWYVYGQGTVTEDGTQVVPDRGVSIYEFTGAMINVPGLVPPAEARAPGNDAAAGDPVDLGTGLFVLEKTDLVVQDILPIVLTRTYRPQDSASRPFGIGATHPYGIFLWSAQQYQEADLILPDGGRIHYVRISPGTGFLDAEFEHTATPTRFYKSRITWNGQGWDLTLKDGTVYVFGENAPLQSIRDRYGNQVTLIRTSGQSGNITQITSTNGRWVQFTYDASNRITQATDNAGRVVSYTYDASGRLWKVTDPSGGVTEYTYDSSHRMLTLKDARGIIFLTNQYDASGRVVHQTQADGTTYQFAYTVDGTGKVTQADVTDPRGFIRRVTFNTNGYMLTDTSPLGTPQEQGIMYERQAGTNFITATIDALSRRTEYTYDAMGNVTSITRLAGTPDAVTTTLTYESTFNQVTSVTDPLSHTTAFAYDSAGNLTTATDPLGNQTSLSYNAAGQPVSITDPLGNSTQFSYVSGDLVTVSDPLGNTTTRWTDVAGRLVSLTNPLGSTTQYAYDALNRLTQVTDPLGGQTAFSYDPNGNLLSVTDARGSATSYTYNSMDRLATRTDPLLRAESYLYEAAGNLTQVTDRKGQVTSFTYDALNRRTQATYDDTSTTTYTYDAGNRLTQVADSISGTITRTYDGLDRVTSESTPQGSVSYGYDAAGRRTSMTVAGEPAVNYTYDNTDRLTQITQGASVVALTYDAASRRSSLTLPNGVVVDYAYDASSRITSITYTAGTTVLGDLTYQYDAAGNRTEVGGTWARTGLPQAVASATYDAANQMLTFGSQTLTHDANGNLTNDGSKTYTWNARNQLVSMTGASFGYDGLGRRVQKSVGGSTTDFLYDGVNPVQELSGGTPTANLLTGLGIDEYFTRGTETLLTDALGSTVGLTDAAGTVQTQYTYEPFGVTTATGTGSANRFLYTGRENDDTGLYYYRARYYDPTFQRFISEDPIEFTGGDLNLYAYALDSPVNFTDPMGEIVIFLPIARIVTGAAVGGITSVLLDLSGGQSINWRQAIKNAALGALLPIPGANLTRGFAAFGRFMIGAGAAAISGRGKPDACNSSLGQTTFDILSSGGLAAVPNLAAFRGTRLHAAMPTMDIRTFLMLNARQNAGLTAEAVGDVLTAIDRQLIGRGLQRCE